jgi:hypothetical protein
MDEEGLKEKVIFCNEDISMVSVRPARSRWYTFLAAICLAGTQFICKVSRIIYNLAREANHYSHHYRDCSTLVSDYSTRHIAIDINYIYFV